MVSSPIRIHPQNSKLFEFRGRPLVLLTATEHYGAVMNRSFRFERYLDDAADKGITLTRLFTLFRELQTSINPYSTCKPESPDYIAPFERTGPGRALDGESKFDLARPNPEFFERLRSFLMLASGARDHRRGRHAKQHLQRGRVGTRSRGKRQANSLIFTALRRSVRYLYYGTSVITTPSACHTAHSDTTARGLHPNHDNVPEQYFGTLASASDHILVRRCDSCPITP